MTLAPLGTDQDDFLRLYDETSARIYGLVLRVVRDPGLAEQVTREVYLQAWAASHPAALPAPTAAVLMSAAHRCAVDHVRRPEPATAAATRAPAPVARPLAAAETPAASRAGRALADLPGPQREAVELAYFGGYTHAEVGSLVGAARGHAQVLIRDGMRTLSRRLLEPA